MAIETHLPLGMVSGRECDKYNKAPSVYRIAGSLKEAEARRLRFYAGDVCENNHRIRDLITGVKQPFSPRIRRNGRCVYCEFWKRFNLHRNKKKRRRIVRQTYGEIKDKTHRV